MKIDPHIEEQLKMYEGKDHWHLNTKKAVTFSDGPNGLRIEDQIGIGFNHSKQATVFPTAACVGCSWDRELLHEYGGILAEECMHENVDVILGPGVNTKRNPKCGRSFEYFAEDPVLSGEYAAAYIKGVQEKGIGTSLKHFAGNSCELGRQVQDSIMDERTLHELYLRQFETAVKKAHPWTIMAAYNRLNGVYCCENKELFEEARSWGFQGIFVSDWGGVSDPVHSIKAGLNVEMPGPDGAAEILAEAAAKGDLSEECIKESSAYLDAFVERCGRYPRKAFDQMKHDDFCEKSAEESIVLLKNEHVLPLQAADSLAVIGPFAVHPCIQGSGSSQVNAKDQDWFLKALDESGIHYTYAPGYQLDSEDVSEDLQEQALQAVIGKNKVIFFAGELSKSSGEGLDRTSMDLPLNQNALLRDLIHQGCHVIVVIQTGSPVTLPWRDMAGGIVLEYAAGSRSGIALKNILYGDVNPSGHLAETWPMREEDVPGHRYFDVSPLQSQYREGIFCGYRYYDTFAVPAAYSFGYGLSYTEFAFQNLKISREGKDVRVQLTVKNIGEQDGRAVVQLYVRMQNSHIARANKELKDFASVSLQVQEEKEVSFVLKKDAFAYYDVKRHSWQIEKGTYQIMLGRAVNDIILQGEIVMDGIEDACSTLDRSYIHYSEGTMYVKDEDFARMLGHAIPVVRSSRPFTPDTTIRELKACGLGRVVNYAVARIMHCLEMNGVDKESVYNAPIRQMLWLREHYTWKTVYAATAYMNHHGRRELKMLLPSLKKK